MFDNSYREPFLSEGIASEIVRDRQAAATRKTGWNRGLGVALGLVLIFSVAVRLLLLDYFRMDFDEGVHLMWAQLLADGYEPYVEVFIGYPPLFPEGLALAWSLAGTPNGVRVVMVLWNSLSLLAVALVAKEIHGYKAGIGAALLVALAPYHIFYSRAILADLPAISLATLSMWLGVRTILTGRIRWLLMGGIAFGASLLIKPLFPFGILVLGALIAERHLGDRRTNVWLVGRDVGLLAASVVLPALIAFLVYDPGALYDQAIAFRMVARGVHTLDLPDKLRRVWSLASDNLGLILLAGYGIFRLPRLPRCRWGIAVWLGVALLTILYQRPLRPHHLSVLLPPLTLLGGIGAGDLVEQVSRPPERRRAVLAAGGLAIYLALLPFSLATLQNEELRPVVVPGRQDMVTFIKHVTSPEDCIITDDPAIALSAGLLMPPPLAEPSEMRTTSGYLTGPELVAVAQGADCQVVVFSRKDMFQEYFPEFQAWVQAHYLMQRGYHHDSLYFIKRGVHTPPGLAATSLNGQITLYGDGLSASVWEAGQSVPVRLFWEVESPVSTDYKVFAHLRNDENQTVAQADHQPFAGLLPTSAWPASEVIAETFWLSLPADLPAGTYRLLVGLYQPDTGERLPVVNDVSGENAVIVGTVSVVSP